MWLATLYIMARSAMVRACASPALIIAAPRKSTITLWGLLSDGSKSWHLSAAQRLGRGARPWSIALHQTVWGTGLECGPGAVWAALPSPQQVNGRLACARVLKHLPSSLVR